MSLKTLWEAAKYLEMQEQEQQQQHRPSVEAPLAAAIGTISNVNGGSPQMSNGVNGAAQATFALQPLKIVNAQQPASLGNGNAVHSAPSTQTVVISSNNISSAFLQGVHGPITFATGSPTAVTATTPNGPITTNNGLWQPKKEQPDSRTVSPTVGGPAQRRIMHNSFDIMNPLVIDESGPAESKKLKQPPMVFRAGTREVHNKLEKCRRAHLKECFDILKKQLPVSGDEKKTSNLSILHSALKYIQTLKKREAEYEHQLERLAREKIAYQQRFASLKKDCHLDHVDFSKFITELQPATAAGDCLPSPTHSSASLSPRGHIVSPTYSTSDPKLSEDTYSEYSDDTSISMGPASDPPAIPNSVIQTANGDNKVSIPAVGGGKTMPAVAPSTANKEVTQPVQPAGISVLPVSYPVNQGLVLQKVAILPTKGLTDMSPIVSTHFITTPQQLNGINGQINGKVVPLTQYIVKPMVVVSTPSPRPGS